MQKQILKSFFLFVIFLMAPFFVYAATPTISNVTGTVANGQTLTIGGLNMINENPTNWQRIDPDYDTSDATVLQETYFDAEDCTGTSTSSGKMCSLGWHSSLDPGNTAGFDSSFYVLGSKSIKLVDNTVCANGATSCGAANIYHIRGMSTSAPWYASAYVYMQGQFARHYQKFFLTVGDPDIDMYIQPCVNTDGTATGWTVKDASEGSVDVCYGSTTLTKNMWHHWEAKIDPTTSPGDTFTVWWDGIQVVQHTFSAHYPQEAPYKELGIPNWSYTLSTPFTMWINRYVISSSRIYPASTIEISGDGGSTWTWQPPTYLSDTGSAITANLPTLTAANYFLRVTNNLQQTSSIYMLGSADTTPPASPSGLSVS